MALLERHGDDPIVVDAALSGLRGSEAAVLEKAAAERATQTPQREAAITMLAATIVRGGQDAAVQTSVAAIGDDGRPAWQRSALLRGAEVALLGAPMPGTPPARRGAAAGAERCRVRPVRAGAPVPAGAYAFRTGRRADAGAARRPRPLRLNREPAALSALAARAAISARAPAACSRASSGRASRAPRRRSRR